MLRLFTGIAIPPALSARIALLQGGVPGARWVPRENFHVTLTFLGEVDEDAAERADEALSAVRAESFSLKLAGAGNFSQGKHPQVLWLGVEKNPALFALKEKTDRALEMARVPFEARKYTPHLTLARMKHAEEGMLADFLRAQADFSAPAFEVESFVLYQSHQTKNGSVYEELREYPLLPLRAS
jgi:2'-5' RNA ligase